MLPGSSGGCRRAALAGLILCLSAGCGAKKPAPAGDGGPLDGGALDTALDAGAAIPDAGDAGASVFSVSDAVLGQTNLYGHPVELHGAVVVAAHGQPGDGGQIAGVFYVQDPGVAGPGLAVVRSELDDGVPFPHVGDQVTVAGTLALVDGVLQLGRTDRRGLVVTIGGSGTTLGGAYPPAGAPIQTSSVVLYRHSPASNHAQRVGNAIQFAGPLHVTNASAFMHNAPATPPAVEGFEVENALWIDQRYIAKDCLQGLDGGVRALNLSRGVRGVWDRYQNTLAGTEEMPATRVAVLYPMSCDDLKP